MKQLVGLVVVAVTNKIGPVNCRKMGGKCSGSVTNDGISKRAAAVTAQRGGWVDVVGCWFLVI